jgi:hypothetical protein
MGRIITLSLAVLMTPVVVLSPEAKAQQVNLSQAQRQQAIFRQTQDAAMAAAAGPEFCQRGPCPGFENVVALHRSMMSSKAPKPVGKAKASGPFPPQPYQPSRSELQTAAQAQQRRSSGGAVRVDDDATGYSPQLEARANAIFGKGNVGNESARQRWMADHEQQAIANEINRTKPLLYPVSGR